MSTTTTLPLAGKSALVTGAARSIGAEIALTLCPFLIESDFSAERFHAHSIEEVQFTAESRNPASNHSARGNAQPNLVDILSRC